MKIEQIDNETVLVDARRGKTTEGKIRAAVLKHFKMASVGDQLANRNPGEGLILWGNLVNFYRMGSINPDIVVASTKKMTPAQTRKITRNFLA
jgi:hypothetical protein